MTTRRRLQTRVPTTQLGRWLLRSGIRLPAPLVATHLMNLPVDLEDLAEITAPRTRGSATPDELEGLDHGVAALLADSEDLLRSPDLVVWATVTQRRTGKTRTVAALLRGSRALLVEDTVDQCVLQPLTTADVASTIATRIAPQRPGTFAPVDVPRAALAAVSSSPSPRSQAADRALQRAAIDPASLDPVWRVQSDVHWFALLGAAPVAGASGRELFADLYAGPAGAVLKYESGGDRIRLEPADRSSLTRLLVAIVSAAS